MLTHWGLLLAAVLLAVGCQPGPDVRTRWERACPAAGDPERLVWRLVTLADEGGRCVRLAQPEDAVDTVIGVGERRDGVGVHVALRDSGPLPERWREYRPGALLDRDPEDYYQVGDDVGVGRDGFAARRPARRVGIALAFTSCCEPTRYYMRIWPTEDDD